MASITIRNLDDSLKQRLRVLAAEHGNSMEEEAREILRRAVSGKAPQKIGSAIRARFSKAGGFDLEQSEREILRDPPAFE